ncbi:SixA phosphatase family protein [Pseudonocardia sp. H11422]|uniref:SixA phosphatase family protein n=1 Tax=Pseudonocardia sp. H11422 TaxID=2835866 RepID=UPI001BDCB542|nr:histidine phosphatase family protein [Pseudonocardia sp. H11422]
MAPTKRRLVIVRHAKSAWPAGVADIDRPLGPRGRRDAPAIGRWLHDHVEHIDAVVSSPAVRAEQTWELASDALGTGPRRRFDERVYAASATELLDVVRQLPAKAATTVLVGHNPGLEDLVTLLTGEEPVMKTSSVAVVSWPGSWADATSRRARLEQHATPRG